jgi:glycosyltransferase involved in cell wall biosynthesis
LRTSLGFGNELIGVFVGRLVTEKNLSLLIKAWTNTFTHEDKVKLLLVGDGYLKDELTKQVKDCKREKQIIFLGAKSDIKPFLQVADFSVLPSLFEGLSNTLLEYLATSLPVIGSRVSGTEDLIEDGVNGYLFESGNCSELEEKLKKMASLSEIKIASMGRNARSTVTQYAGIESVSSRLCNLYK